MKACQCALLLVCVALVNAGPVQQLGGQTGVASGPLGGPTSRLRLMADSGSNNSFSRSKRWLLSLLLGYGSLQDGVESKRDTEASKQNDGDQHVKQDDSEAAHPVEHGSHRHSSGPNSRHHPEDEGSSNSVESHNLPGTVAVDLSGDTRVNYPDGNSRFGSLARESDAEVFDWNLLQEDRDRNAGDQNPHFFRSDTRSGSGAGHRRTGGVSSSSSYGTQARPVRGFVIRTNSYGQTGSNINPFNRIPISYEQSQEFVNSRRRHFGTRN